MRRRSFLLSLPAVCLAQNTSSSSGKSRIFSSALQKFADRATEFPVSRLTDPTFTSYLPPSSAHSISHRGGFLLYASNLSGRFEVFHLDLHNAVPRQISEAEALDPRSIVLSANERTAFYFDGPRLMEVSLTGERPKEIYRVPDGFEPGSGWSLAEDGQYAAILEKTTSAGTGADSPPPHFRLQLIHLAARQSVTIAESGEEMRNPVMRPRRAAVLYARADELWLTNYDAAHNYRLHIAEGETGPAFWSPDGRQILYLNYPSDPHKLHNIREFTPDTNEEKMISPTTQFVCFSANGDASVFVGASGSKASPYVLVLVRSVKRELTLCEHRASDPHMVEPRFSPNSQHVYFTSDLHGKPAIYSMNVERLVEETETGESGPSKP